MNTRGQLTLPESVREALQVPDGHGLQLELEVVDHSVVLRPAYAIPEEDLWAYTPEHMAKLRRALAEGPGRRMSEAELLRLIDEIDEERRDRRDQ